MFQQNKNKRLFNPGVNQVSKIRGCAIRIAKVPPIKLEKFPKSITINPESFLKTIPIYPEIPKKLINELSFTKTHTNKYGKRNKSLKSIPINPDSILKKVP